MLNDYIVAYETKYIMYVYLLQWHIIKKSIFLLFCYTYNQNAICNKLFYTFSYKLDKKLGHILEPNDRPLNDERLHHVPLIFQIYHDNSMHILDSSQRLQ